VTRALLLAALTVVLAAAVPAQAIVPPRDCGRITVKSKRYNIKADQMRCADAVRYSRRYLASSRRKPSGYRCRRYGRETKLVFRCQRGVRNFFAIRR
jgi:hypothetical protein